MNRRSHTRRGVSLMVVSILAGALAAEPAATAPPAGHVEEVRGSAVAELAGKTKSLVPLDPVFIGESVATGSGSRAALQLGTSTSLRMGEFANVRIDRFLVDAGGEITLTSGPILLDKATGSPDQPVRIRSAFGLITVRGTQIWAGTSQGVFGVFVAHGMAEVTAQGVTITVGNGQGTDLALGAPPTNPHPWSAARLGAALASVD